MPNVRIDLTNYSPSFGDKVDPGRYIAAVSSVKQDRSKAGNDMLVVWLEISSGPFKGKALRTNLTLTEKAMFKVVEFLSALGYQTPKKALSVDTDAWIGKTVVVDVEERENEYNGNTTVRSEIGAVLRATPELIATLKGSAASTTAAPAVEPEDEEVVVDDAPEEAPAEPEAVETKTTTKPVELPAGEGVEVTDASEDVDLDALTEL